LGLEEGVLPVTSWEKGRRHLKGGKKMLREVVYQGGGGEGKQLKKFALRREQCPYPGIPKQNRKCILEEFGKPYGLNTEKKKPQGAFRKKETLSPAARKASAIVPTASRINKTRLDEKGTQVIIDWEENGRKSFSPNRREEDATSR